MIGRTAKLNFIKFAHLPMAGHLSTESRNVDSTSINSIMWHRKRKGLEYQMFLGSRYFDGDDWEMLIP